MDACTLKYGTNRTTSDNTGTCRCWAKKNYASCCFTLDRVRNGVANAWDAEESLLGFFDTLSDRGWNFFSLAVADTDHAVAVADNN